MNLIAVLAFREANRANAECERALSHQLVANARDQLQVDQELAVLLAREAYDTKPTAEAAAVLRQAVIDSRMRAAPTGAPSPAAARTTRSAYGGAGPDKIRWC
jgi:hypothetical protein